MVDNGSVTLICKVLKTKANLEGVARALLKYKRNLLPDEKIKQNGGK